MREITSEILIILFLVLANGVFAMTEIAVVSARKARLQQWANEGNHRAQNALDLANSPNRFLATIQVVITLITLLTGAYGYEKRLAERYGFSAEYKQYLEDRLKEYKSPYGAEKSPNLRFMWR